MNNKKIGKITKSTSTRISSPFDIQDHKTERSAVAVLMHWMRNIIEQDNIDLGLPDVETSAAGKFPDTVIYKTRRSQVVLCEMEFKPPYYEILGEELKNIAREKAVKRHAKYFVTANFQELILWNTEKVNAQKPEEEQISGKYHLSAINDFGSLERNRIIITDGLTKFLKDLFEVSAGIKAEPKLAIDEFLIWRLQEKINKLAFYYQSIICDQAHKDKEFAQSLSKWFNNQGWSFFIESDVDYEKAARQTAYLLVNKIVFYNALQIKQPQKLAPLEIPEGLFRGSQLHKILQSYFDNVLEIDYETIYTADFIDNLAFLDSRDVVEEIKNLVKVLDRYNFSTLGYDVIGRIFEKIIPPAERHHLGQYFTNPDIVDLILKFALRHEDDKVFDPSCGAGTFLVRAYQHKKLSNQYLTHEKIIGDLWGNDIAKFPAHLSTINLAINDLSVDSNYPNVIQKDFFDLLISENKGFELPENTRKAKLRQLGSKELEVTYPRYFDAIVGNPPYTRQEEISEISSQETYKDQMIQKAVTYGNHKQIANISRRAGVYAYFFVHGTKFLNNGGRFGFIVSNAWLDVEYGAGLQEFFLNNYKIVAIIESKVERWFEDADINTSIILLEKASGVQYKKERDESLVRFVYLLKPLRRFIPPAENMWEKQVDRLRSIDSLLKTILAHDEFYQNEDLRIYPKKQSELYEEGFDIESHKYIGSKWGKYVRAPEIFFKILEKGKDKLVPLKHVADIRRGITTGANEFFYLTDEEIKRRKIEKEFWMHQDEKGNWIPNYIIKSPRECKSIKVKPKDLAFRVLMIHKDKQKLQDTNVLQYINEGEKKGFNKRPTCASREKWYDLEEVTAPILSRRFIDQNFSFIFNDCNAYVGDTFFVVTTNESEYSALLSAALNSTLYSFMMEIYGRTPMGEGVLLIYGPEIKPLPVFPLSGIQKFSPQILQIMEKIANRELKDIFEEIGAVSPEKVRLENIKEDRRQLDKIVMGEILGLSDEEQIEVYKAVIDSVKSRGEKAKSLNNKNKKGGLNVDALVNTIVEKVGENTIGKMYQENILSSNNLYTKKLPEFDSASKIEKGLFGWQIVSGDSHLTCQSKDEARYLKIWIDVGQESIKIPKDQQYLEKVVGDLETLKSQIDQIIENYISSILDPKLKSQILHRVWQGIL